MKKQNAFDVTACGARIGDAVVGMQGFESNRAVLNGALKEAYLAKAIWGASRNEEGSLAQAIWASWEITRPDVAESTKKVDLTVLKKCFTLGIQVECLSSGAMNRRIKDGTTYDLITGEKKVIKVKGKSAPRAKSEATVKHCGYGLLAALEAEGFGKWVVHFLNVMDLKGHDSTDLVELIMDDARQALRDCGFATQDDKGNLVATVIKESDNEADE